MSWFLKLIEKLNIRGREKLRKVKPKARRITISLLALLMVLAMVFGFEPLNPTYGTTNSVAWTTKGDFEN